MAELERFTVEERTEWGTLEEHARDVIPATDETDAHRVAGVRLRFGTAEVVSRRVFVMRGEWQPVTLTVGVIDAVRWPGGIPEVIPPSERVVRCPAPHPPRAHSGCQLRPGHPGMHRDDQGDQW